MTRYFLLILAAVLAVPSGARAQAADKYRDYYRSPMNIPLILSANFAETRTNHFHSGIDIKTGGKEGEPIYAAADGYIVRIGVIPSGFGRVLYIAHPNGTTTVYAHMQWFTNDVEAYVASERHRQKLHRIDLYPPVDKFPVSKGQMIGYSGNSGASFGPHLHFELRNSASQRTVNLIKLGVYNITDDILPMIEGLYYVGVDTVNNVPVHSAPKKVKVVKTSDGSYALSDTAALEVGRRGYFVLEATDRKNNTHNTMGIYRVVAKLDGEPYFSFKLDEFSFADTRYVNSLSHYALQKGSRNELLRLAVQAGNRLPIYSGVKNRGLITLDDEKEHAVEITAEDDSGNISVLSFVIRPGQAGVSPVNTEGIPVDNRRSYNRSGGGVDISIPAGALYEPVFYTQSIDSLSVLTGGKATAVPCYSQVYTIHNEDTPLHTNMKLAITPADVPAGMRAKLCLAKLDDKGALGYAGGKYENGKVSGTVRTFGRYFVAADTLPPAVTPSFSNNADLKAAKSMSFTIKDDFSGVASFYATIDGNWIPFEQKGGKITHWFDRKRIAYNGNSHDLVITVTDNKGNQTTLRRKFIK